MKIENLKGNQQKILTLLFKRGGRSQGVTAKKSRKGVTYYDSSKVYEGYTLFSPLGGFQHMLEVDSDNNVVWEYEDPLINHDFYRMESGNTMYIKYVLVLDNIKNKVKGGIPVGATTPLWCDALDEVNLKGEVVWEWLAYEHLDPEIDVMCPLMHRPFSKFSYSRVVEINPKTNTIEWEYKDDPPFAFFSSNQGGCQRLPNGNTLITDSDAGRIFEVAHEGEIVWEFVNPSCSFDPVYGHNNIVPRALSLCSRL